MLLRTMPCGLLSTVNIRPQVGHVEVVEVVSEAQTHNFGHRPSSCTCSPITSSESHVMWRPGQDNAKAVNGNPRSNTWKLNVGE